ncbi:MAG: aminotransferase class [Thermomicrobiales bacterium]|nr:aminotransferase class [Thermomicrobiales bacterium]MCD6056944.1 aminotransferase class [Thermomicrobiales bacterium]MDF3017490.1 aminotransferase class [Thermomicrobiales bacterium]
MSVNFRLPGPTPLPPQVLAALGRDMIPHRGPAFRALYREILKRAREVHRTEGDVLTWAATGSAGWEVAVVNLLSPGDPVLVAVNGDFGERFARAAGRLGIDVRRIDVEWGEPVLPGEVRSALEAHSEVRAVFLVHNETSTGVTNPLRDLAAVVREHGALVVVDAVSAAGALPLEVDTWGIDFVFSGSQKAWMCPPGLLIVAAGPRAWDAHQRSTYPRFFWDMSEAKKWAEQGMTPTTPPLSMLYAFQAALDMIAGEGIDEVWARHRRLGEMTREGLAAAGLRLFAQRGFESDSVTAFLPPPDVTAGELLEMLRRDYGVEAQGGQAHLADRLIRVGHMGWVHEPEMQQAIDAISAACARLSSTAGEPTKPEPVPVRVGAA